MSEVIIKTEQVKGASVWIWGEQVEVSGGTFSGENALVIRAQPQEPPQEGE